MAGKGDTVGKGRGLRQRRRATTGLDAMGDGLMDPGADASPPSPPSLPSAPLRTVDGRVDATPRMFPIVAIGASAGGLDAFTQLLGHLPSDTGMAFVLIQHLDPTHQSFLSEAMAKATGMSVSQVKDGERPAPNHVYAIPPGADIAIRDGVFALVARADTRFRLHLPIDFFFNTLATERGSRAIGVVLSGTGSDGAGGLGVIKTAGGITLAQEPRTAKFGGMPKSAIEAGVVDYVLPIEGLAKELVRLSRHAYLVGTQGAPSARAAESPEPHESDDTVDSTSAPTNGGTMISRIQTIIKAVVGIDFAEYKAPTFERRLSRRMALRRIEDQEDYLKLLERDPEEVRVLYEDTLIHVSSFFRDPEVFEMLKVAVFPKILEHKDAGAPIRIWVAGCSTGEEVYSLALSLLEFLGDSPQPHPVQIFGSDVSEQAIQTARQGRYSDGAMKGISEEQRRRFFTKMDTGFRINKSVRDLCVFVRHDLARDPPFSKVDLLSCRNVLIYFDQALQKRVLPTFHFSLNQPGFLLLGRSENISGFARLFSPVDEASKLFTRSAVPSGLRFAARTEVPPGPHGGLPLASVATTRSASDIARHLDALLLARYAPPGVLVNDKLEVLQFRGQTGSFLQSAPGEPQSNIIKMARAGLRAKLQDTLARAKRDLAPARTEGVEVEQDGFTKTCDIVVLPFARLPGAGEQLFVVLFEEAPSGVAASGRPSGRSSRHATRTATPSVADALRIPKLEHELSATTEYLNSLIEEHSRTNDDLGSANEELVSGNEELQSLNEELETAKEELQSTNEELTTVNDELHSRNVELGQVNNDLVNVLDTVDVPIIILDKGRHIRRFTRKAPTILNVLPSDMGRLFDDIKLNIKVPDLDRQVADVISTFATTESEVQDNDGRWYRMQIRPYKTADNRVDGAVISLFDIDALKHLVTDAQEARQLAQHANLAKDQFLAVLSHELRTPLSALLLQTQVLRRVGTDAVKRDRACDAIDRSTRMQVQLVDDLLDVSRIVTGKMRVVLEPVNLGALVDGTMDSMAALAGSKSIQLQRSVDRSLGPIAGDQTRLDQVVCNLLANAIKFTPPGGKIDVVVERSDGLAHLQIRDSGMGIEPAFLPQIFDRLTQRDGSSTRAHSGLGLGLAIVRYLVEAHGGQVRAESPGPGLGSTFHVNLPLIPSVSEPLMRQQNLPDPDREGRGATTGRLLNQRILIVEDDVEIRDALAEMMAQTGATVMTAESAAAGMVAFRQFHPDVLLCDIAMPGEDGYSFIRKVRASGADNGGNTPALALTALMGDMHRRRALAEGFQMQLIKPIDSDALEDAVVGLLTGDRQFSAVQRRREPPVTPS